MKDQDTTLANEQHPIERIMTNAMTKIKTLVDTDTIIGTPVTTADGTMLIPVSQVSMGFLTGGGEYSDTGNSKKIEAFPFAGGSGAGVSVKPIGFLVNTGSVIKMISLDGENAYSKILDLVPKVIESFMSKPEK